MSAENKVKYLGKMIAVPAHAKYQIIQEMMQREGNILNITWLCNSANVSRSGYYHYLETEEFGYKGKSRISRILR